MADIKLPLDIEVRTQRPLESNRGPVQVKSDLINPDTWAHDGDIYYVYDGMIVPVLSTGDLWMLIDSSKLLDDRYQGWKLIGGNSGGNLDGGRADDVYTPSQIISCGGALE